MQACLGEPRALAAVVAARVETRRAVPNAPLRMSGWVEQLSDSGARFRVRAEATCGIVCEATIDLVAVREVEAGTRPLEAMPRCPQSAATTSAPSPEHRRFG